MSKWTNRIVGYGNESPDQLLANPQNHRIHPKHQQKVMAGALDEIGWIQDVIVNKTTGHIVDGHLRVELALREEEQEVPVKYVELTPDQERKALATLDPIGALAEQDQEMLNELITDIEQTDNFAFAEYLSDLYREPPSAEDETEAARQSLAERFLIPPFSVLDAKQGYWKDRKKNWLRLGIKSELGRTENLAYAASSQPPSTYEFKNQVEKELGRKLDWQEFAERYPEEMHHTGTSVFDPVLCEVMYSWFTPPQGKILDPFAGGSVRGVVAGMLGYDYTGLELRPEQVRANRANWHSITTKGGIKSLPEQPDNQPDLTPVEARGELHFKRDDLYAVADSRGAKTRACWHLAQGAEGLITAGSRQSPQVNIVANIARRLGLPCRVHVPAGKYTPELRAAEAAGAEVIQHKAGYNNVIVARAREDAEQSGWREIPFGMECPEAVTQTAAQVENLPWGDFKRIVIPVGSGMNLAGLLQGIATAGQEVEILGIQVGADPTKRLDAYAPKDWREMVTLTKTGTDYHDAAAKTEVEGITLDPIYEAKCIPFLEPGDLLWCVGIRQTATTETHDTEGSAEWINTDSLKMDDHLEPEADYDLVFSCPPYADLEVYSDDPSDLSSMDYAAFLEAYEGIIAKACARLKPDRFAVWVIGEVRDKKGKYYGFVQDTIKAFQAAGMDYYNEIILVTPIGSNAIRAGRMFQTSRKLVKGHQNALVFTNADDPKKATTHAIKGLSNAIAEHFNDHRQVFEAMQNIMVFCNGNPKAAAEAIGDPATADLEALMLETIEAGNNGEIND